MSNRLSMFGMAVLIALSTSACERQVREARNSPATPDAAQPTTDDAMLAATRSSSDDSAATTTSTAALANTQPTYSVLTIDNLDRRFPLNKVLIHTSEAGGSVVAELFSDLPKSSLRRYDGNEIYLEMRKLEGVSGNTLDGATWRFRSPDSGKSDSPNGIFLNGQQTNLQPFDVLVKFESRQERGATSPHLYAIVRGQFRSYEAGAPEALAPFASVYGQLPVEVVQKR